MRVAVTGGFGFIGSNLVKTLVSSGYELVVFDNLSTGDYRFLTDTEKSQITFIQMDIAKAEVADIKANLMNTTTIFHLAANADVRGGWNSTFRDIEENVIATHNVSLAAREANVSQIVFASTAAVYGDSKTIPTPETEVFPIQTSLYGASKIAAEGILASFAANGAFKVTCFRFVSVLGQNYHHGHVIDFVRKLKENPIKLSVLGNGKQKKSYIHVSDCVEGLLNLRSDLNYDVFNIGHSEFIEVSKSAKLISDCLNLQPKYIFEDKDRGWVGDNPFTFLDIEKAKKFGWVPKVSIEKSITDTVNWIEKNPWVLNKKELRK
jgi:UDP-glucose 4-epimerase